MLLILTQQVYSSAGPASCGVGSGLPVPRRRTLATNTLFFARSDAAFAPPSWLRSAAYAGSWGMGSPSRRFR